MLLLEVIILFDSQWTVWPARDIIWSGASSEKAPALHPILAGRACLQEKLAYTSVIWPHMATLPFW